MSATNVTSFAASLADLGISADENPLAPLFSQLRNLYASLFMTVAGVALFMYDWLIMFDDEWQHIWYGGRINSVKLLYILNRILTPAILAVDLYDKGGLAKNMTQETCRWALNFDGWGTIISYGSIHWIVTLRVWTVYGRSRRLLAVFGVTFLAYFVATSYIWARGSAEISKTIFPSPVVVRICYTVIPEWLWWLWVPNIVYECIIFFATLWKAWEHHQANLNTPILAVLYRDGFIYFFVICLLSLANMFTWLWAPHSLAILFKYFSLAAVNVAASRLVLDLRTVGQANRTTLNAGTAVSRPTVVKRASHPLHVSLDRQLQDVEMSPRYQGYADLSNGPGELYRNPSSHGHGQHGTAVPEGRSVFVEDDPEMLEGWEVVQRQEVAHSRSLSSATATAFSPKSVHGHMHSPSTHSHRAYGQVPMSAGGASNPRSPFSPQETDRFYTPTSPTSASIGMRALSPASPRSPTGGSRIPPELIAAIDFGPPDEPTPKAQKRFSQRKPAPPAIGLGLEPPPRRNPARHPYAPQSDSPSVSDYSPSIASFSNSVHSANPPHTLAGSFVPRMSISGSLRSYDPEAADAIDRDAAALDRDGRHGSFQGTALRPHRESAGSVSVYSQQDGAPNPYRASNVSHATTFGRSHQTHGTQATWSEEGGGAGAQYGRQQR